MDNDGNLKGDKYTVVPEPHSYRGIYRDLAFEIKKFTEYPCIMGEFNTALEKAIGSTYTGYKGGDFTMSKNTNVWVDFGVSSCGYEIVGIEMKDDNTVMILIADDD